MDFIPFIDGNKEIVSPKFIPIIMDSCSLIDSILNSFASGKSERYNLKKYSEMYEPTLQLETNISLFLSSPIKPMTPFSGWTKGQPSWWAAYNAIKHDRLNNYKEAKFVNAATALAGLHQVMSRFKEFIGAFLRVGWLDTSEIETLADLGSVAHLSSLHPQPPSLVVESRLFVSASRDNFVNSYDDFYFDIDYDTNGISSRVRNLLFAHDEW
jgi:hypothetical protein